MKLPKRVTTDHTLNIFVLSDHVISSQSNSYCSSSSGGWSSAKGVLSNYFSTFLFRMSSFVEVLLYKADKDPPSTVFLYTEPALRELECLNLELLVEVGSTTSILFKYWVFIFWSKDPLYFKLKLKDLFDFTAAI
jgi:hypothetical protein